MYGMACPPKTILDRRATDSSNELVDLYTHRIAFVSELSEKDRFSESTIKAFTGGTVLSARRLYGEYNVPRKLDRSLR
jgi:phage/plasmid-associated DNA primase